MNQLTDEELMMSPSQLIFHWLTINKIGFADVMAGYVSYLEETRKKNRSLIVDLSIPLVTYWQANPKISEREYMRKKSAKALLDSEVFKGALVEDELRREL